MSHQPDATWTPLDAAASALGISPDAARKRLERGTLAGEKRAGRWYVALNGRTPVDATLDAIGRRPSGQPDAIWTPPDAIRTPPDAGSDATRDLVDHLTAEVAYLRDQLDASRRELADERQRFDVLHREALARIPALGAGGNEPPGANGEVATHAVVPQDGREGGGGGVDASLATAPQEAPQRSWWRRLFGGG